MKRLYFLTAVIMLTLMVTITTQEAALGYTEGKTVRIILGVSPGGGHDTEARMIARHLPKYLPGKPKNIIILNRPGAGGTISATNFYKRSKPDGLSMAIIGSSQYGNQALSKVNYDVTKMPNVFSTSGSGATIVRDTLGVKKGADITKVKPSDISVSGRTINGLSFLTDVLGLEVLGVDGYKYVVGYPGTAQMSLAFESGEISYVGGTGLHHALGKQGRYYKMIQDGKAVLLWQTGVITPEGKVVRAVGTEVPAFPEIYKQVKGKDPSGPKWGAYKLVGPASRTLNRALVFPPGVSKEKIAYMRAALDKLYKDPEYKKEWERVFGLNLDYIKGADADKILKDYMAPSPGWEYLKGDFIPKLKGNK